MKKKRLVACGLIVSTIAMAAAGCSGGQSSSDTSAPATTAAAAAPEAEADQGSEALFWPASRQPTPCPSSLLKRSRTSAFSSCPPGLCRLSWW